MQNRILYFNPAYITVIVNWPLAWGLNVAVVFTSVSVLVEVLDLVFCGFLLDVSLSFVLLLS